MKEMLRNPDCHAHRRPLGVTGTVPVHRNGRYHCRASSSRCPASPPVGARPTRSTASFEHRPLSASGRASHEPIGPRLKRRRWHIAVETGCRLRGPCRVCDHRRRPRRRGDRHPRRMSARFRPEAVPPDRVAIPPRANPSPSPLPGHRCSSPAGLCAMRSTGNSRDISGRAEQSGFPRFVTRSNTCAITRGD